MASDQANRIVTSHEVEGVEAAYGVLQEKREVMKNLGRHRDRLSDPFYQIQNAETSLTESDTHYIVQTKVPEHEKDNVKLFVRDAKVVVQGNRNFADDVKTVSKRINGGPPINGLDDRIANLKRAKAVLGLPA